MIEESGRVIAVERDAVWVETLRRTGCGRCDEPGGCGNAAARLGERTGHVKARNRARHALAVGDYVRVGVPANAVLQGTALLYLLPLVYLLAGALLGEILLAGDSGALAGAAAGIAASFVTLRLLARHGAGPDEPVVLARIDEPGGNQCPP
jgi:sigma-E factor negative regulatory protein RseC